MRMTGRPEEALGLVDGLLRLRDPLAVLSVAWDASPERLGHGPAERRAALADAVRGAAERRLAGRPREEREPLLRRVAQIGGDMAQLAAPPGPGLSRVLFAPLSEEGLHVLTLPGRLSERVVLGGTADVTPVVEALDRTWPGGVALVGDDRVRVVEWRGDGAWRLECVPVREALAGRVVAGLAGERRWDWTVVAGPGARARRIAAVASRAPGPPRPVLLAPRAAPAAGEEGDDPALAAAIDQARRLAERRLASVAGHGARDDVARGPERAREALARGRVVRLVVDAGIDEPPEHAVVSAAVEAGVRVSAVRDPAARAALTPHGGVAAVLR